MLGLTLCSNKLIVASALFLSVNAKNNKFRLGHTISNESRPPHFSVGIELNSLTRNEPFTKGNIDTETIVPLINLMKDDAVELFDLTLTIPDIRGGSGDLTATTTTRFECKINHDDKDSAAVCTTDDDLGSSLILVVIFNGSNDVITGIFNDLTRGLNYQMRTETSKPDYSFPFSISKHEDVPTKVDGLSAAAYSPKAVPKIGVSNRNDIANQRGTTVDLGGQSDVENNILEEDTVVDVLYYYTWRAMCSYTNQLYESCKMSRDARAQIKSLVKAYATYANDVFDKSLTGVRINSSFSIGSRNGYDEGAATDDPNDFLDDLTDNEVNDVHSLRNEKGADLVVGIAFGAYDGVYGVAWTPELFPSRYMGFSAAISCGVDCNSNMAEVLTHEIGHNLGCDHDREAESIRDKNEDFNFGFHYCSTCVASMMSYEAHCESLGCDYVTIIPYFSNPDIEISRQGQKFAIGDSKRNNAQMIRNSKKGVAANYVKGQYFFEVDSPDATFYNSATDVEFIVEGLTAVTIENLEIYFKTSKKQVISISTKLIDTEDEYSLHVEEKLVPMGKGSNVLDDVASFDNFPPIKIAAGDKMKIRIACKSTCIMYNVEDVPTVLKDDHISVQGVKDESNENTFWWGVIFYKPAEENKCKDHKGKFTWRKEIEVRCAWVVKKNKCFKNRAKKFCPKTCGVC